MAIPRNIPKRQNVISMWSFENNLLDKSNYSNNGTATGAANYASASGKIGSYFTDASATVTFANTLVSGTADFSFAGWVNTANNGGRTGFFSFANKTAYLEKNAANNLNYGDGTKTLTAGGIAINNTWVHVGLTRISGTGQLYIAGSANGSSGDISTSLATGGGNLYRGLDAQEVWAYKIDEFLFWNAGLTAGEMATMAALTAYIPANSAFYLFL
jgi:hypothetical protein